MKKRILSVFLALVLCLGLAVPAFASQAVPTAEKALQNCSLSYEVGGKVVKKIEAGNYDTQTLFVQKEVNIVTANNDSVTYDGYSAISSNTTFTAKHAGTTDDGSNIVILLAAFVNDGNGVYRENWVYTQVLTQDGFAAIDAAQDADMVSLKAGQSIQFKLPPVSRQTSQGVESADDVIYGLQLRIFVPIGKYSTMYYSTSPCNFKIDDKAVEVYFANETPAPTFTDVSAGAFYADAVNWAVGQDITNGTGNNKFSPGQDCTHAQILTFLYRAARGKGTAAAGDMDKAISWAREKGMIGADFNSSAKCTRADAVNYIWQAFDKKSAAASSFNDVSASADYAAAVNWAVANGIAEGTGGGNFSPDKVCNRGTIVTLLHRAYVPAVRLTSK